MANRNPSVRITSVTYEPTNRPMIAFFGTLSVLAGLAISAMSFVGAPLLGMLAIFGGVAMGRDVFSSGDFGIYKGDCPYCGASVSVSSSAPAYNCSKCKNTIVISPRRFSEVDRSRLREYSERLADVQKGITDIFMGIKLALFLPVILLLGFFLKAWAVLLVFLWVLASVVKQVTGMVRCLRAPDLFDGRVWLQISIGLQGLLIFLQGIRTLGGYVFLLRGSWFDDLVLPLLYWSSLFAFLCFLVNLSDFLRLKHLVRYFGSIRQDVIIIGVGMIALALFPNVPLISDILSYVPILLLLYAFFVFLGYFSSLGSLKKYLDMSAG